MEKINSQAWYLVKKGEANEAFELRDFLIESIEKDEVIVETFGREPENNNFCGCCGCFPGANLH